MRPNLPPPELNKLFKAIEKGQVTATTRLLVANPALVNEQFEHQTPLNNACRSAKGLKCIATLLAHGADVNKAPQGYPHQTPLRVALSYFAEVAPVLVDAGALPTETTREGAPQYNSFSDLQLAATRCPAIVPELLKRGALVDGNDKVHSPLSAMLSAAAHQPIDRYDRQPDILNALQALIDAGSSLQRTSVQGGVWFDVWNFRTARAFQPHPLYDHIFTQLADAMPEPGLRVRGQTFLHVVARRMQNPYPSTVFDLAWKEILQRYDGASLKDWVQLQPDGDQGFRSLGVVASTIPSPNDGQFREADPADKLDSVAESLRWAEHFVALGADVNEHGKNGRTAAHVLVDYWGWQVLSHEGIRQAVHRLGLDFEALDADGASSLDKLRHPTTQVGRVLMPPKEDQERLMRAFVLETSLPNASDTPRRPRM